MVLLSEQGGHALHLDFTLFDLYRRPTFEHFRHLERLHLDLMSVLTIDVLGRIPLC